MKFFLVLLLFFSYGIKAQNIIPPDSIFHLSNAGVKETSFFKTFLQKIADERWVKNDSAFVDQVYHPQYIHSYENGRSRNKQQIMRIRAPRQAPANQQRMQQAELKATVEKVAVQIYNKTAVVHYFVDMRVKFHNQPVFKLFRCTDIFIKQKNNWQIVSHSETVVPGNPIPVAIDKTVYKDYVGQYQLSPDVIYTVSEKDGRLFWGRNQGFELIPEAQHIFGFKVPATSFSPNSLYRIHFVRNQEGKVSHLHMIEYPGVEYDAVKMK